MPPPHFLSLSPQSAVNADEAEFPKGPCRYILVASGLRGHRCACVGFNHNKTLPSATCDCGHLSCFHVVSADEPSPSKNKKDIDLLKERVLLLEEQVDAYRSSGADKVLSRVSELEGVVDRDREDMQEEVKGSYKNISGAWQLMEQLQTRMTAFEERHRLQNEQLERSGRELRDLRRENRELLEKVRIHKGDKRRVDSSPRISPGQVQFGFGASPSPALERAPSHRNRGSMGYTNYPPSFDESQHPVYPAQYSTTGTMSSQSSGIGQEFDWRSYERFEKRNRSDSDGPQMTDMDGSPERPLKREASDMSQSVHAIPIVKQTEEEGSRNKLPRVSISGLAKISLDGQEQNCP